MHVTVIGAGVAGLVTANVLASRGAAVTVLDRGPGLGGTACSWFAGGMLAPWCEAESTDQLVAALGTEALEWWPRHHPRTSHRGTLVVAPPRDSGELSGFAGRTSAFEWLDEAGVEALEPDLAGRFRKGLFFPREAHLDPRAALASLSTRIEAQGGAIRYGAEADPAAVQGAVVDCRGFAARADWPTLRGVKGEMLVVRSHDIALSRPVRLLHPRIPLYIVPRGEGLFMVGATSIESEDRRRISARSMIELLSAAYALHPAFGEAEVVEIGTDVRPALPDNLPAVRQDGRVVRMNGLYRHGFLLSPAFARMAAEAVLGPVAGQG